MLSTSPPTPCRHENPRLYVDHRQNANRNRILAHPSVTHARPAMQTQQAKQSMHVNRDSEETVCADKIRHHIVAKARSEPAKAL